MWIWLSAKLHMHQGMRVCFSRKLNLVGKETWQRINTQSHCQNYLHIHRKPHRKLCLAFLFFRDFLRAQWAQLSLNSFGAFWSRDLTLRYLILTNIKTAEKNRPSSKPSILPNFIFSLQILDFSCSRCVRICSYLVGIYKFFWKKWSFYYFIIYIFYSYLHTMFGSFLPPSPPIPSFSPPSLPGRNYFALISNFVEERI
jgi:hypothetical protein